ncbi:unnamed protein product [Rotaria magnacalcarata]
MYIKNMWSRHMVFKWAQKNTTKHLLEKSMHIDFGISLVYQTIELKRFVDLASPMKKYRSEKFIVNAAVHNDIQVRIEHKSKALTFGTDLNLSNGQFGANDTGLKTNVIEKCQMNKYVINLHQYHVHLHNDIQVRIEHKSKALTFGTDLNLSNGQFGANDTDERDKEEHRFDMEITTDKLRESEIGRKIIELIGEEELYKYDPELLNSLHIDGVIKYSREQKEKLKVQYKKVDFPIRELHEAEIPLVIKQSEKELRQRHTIQLAERAIERCERFVRMENDKEDFLLSIRGQRHEDFVLHMNIFEQRL